MLRLLTTSCHEDAIVKRRQRPPVYKDPLFKKPFHFFISSPHVIEPYYKAPGCTKL